MNKKVLVAIIVLLLGGVGIWAMKAMRTNPPTAIEQQDKVGDPEADQTAEDEGEDEAIFAEQELTAEEEAQLAAQCENGEWVAVGSETGDPKTVSGRLAVDIPYDEATEEIAAAVTYVINENVTLKAEDEKTLSFFEDRTIEAFGSQSANTMTVAKVRCIGKETDRALIAFRQEMMKHINDRINDIAPVKGNWEVVDFSWPDDAHVYVEYATKEDEEAADDANYYSLLLEVSNSQSGAQTKQIALLKMGNEDWEIVSGTDTFADAEELDYYEYDDQRQAWVKLD